MTTSFVQDLRTASVSRHSDALRAGRVPPIVRPTPTSLARFLSETKHAHEVFRARLPVRTTQDYALMLSMDIERVIPPWDRWPTDRAYAEYLKDLDVPRLGCHFYNTVFAHARGGGAAIYDTVRSEVGDITLQYFENIVHEDTNALAQEFDAMAHTWTPDQKSACIEETDKAFEFGMANLRLLSPRSPTYMYDM